MQSVWEFLSWLLSEHTVRHDGHGVVVHTPGGHVFSTSIDYGTKNE